MNRYHLPQQDIPLAGLPSDACLPPIVAPIKQAHQPPSEQVEPVAAPQRPLSPTEALAEIKATIPPGLELHRSYHYVFPLGKRRKLDLLVLKIHCPDELEKKLNDWRAEMSDRLDPISILVRRVRGTQGILNNLRNTFRETRILTAADRPQIDTMIESLCGRPPTVQIGPMRRDQRREDLTSIPWIAPDSPSAQDIEDLIHAEHKQHGVIMFRTALIDATDYVTPGSPIDKYALRVGSSLYGRQRSISTLPPELAHDAASFVLGKVRPAWVVEGTLSPIVDLEEKRAGSVRYKLDYKIRRGYVTNHRSIDPGNTPSMPADSPFSRSLSAAAQAARILRHLRASKTTPIRVDGAGGPLATVTAELMIESKRILSEYLGEKVPMIYRVHQKPSTNVKEQFHRALNALKIPNLIDDFDSPSQFAGILANLEGRRDPASQALLNDLLDTFLLRTLFSADNAGHYGLRLDSFAEFKPRDAAGLTNQYQLDAVWTGKAPLSRSEIAKRAEYLNERRWTRDERFYNLRFLEMLDRGLALEGDTAVGIVRALEPGKISVEMGGFSKWGVLTGAQSDVPLEIDSPVVARLGGFDLASARFLFEMDTLPGVG